MNILELQLKEYLNQLNKAKSDKKKLEIIDDIYRLGVKDGLNEVERLLKEK